MAAKSLTFDTGIVEYDINGMATVCFNPADESFTRKLYGTVELLDGIQDRVASDSTPFDSFGDLDAEMREAIDDLLGPGVADALFQNMNCYAIADGFPVWMNLVMALVDEVTEAYAREFGKTDARIRAYSGKYDAMFAKYRKGKK